MKYFTVITFGIIGITINVWLYLTWVIHYCLWKMHVLVSNNIHLIVLFEHLHPYEICVTFNKSHVDQEVALIEFPEDHETKKSTTLLPRL